MPLVSPGVAASCEMHLQRCDLSWRFHFMPYLCALVALRPPQFHSTNILSGLCPLMTFRGHKWRSVAKPEVKPRGGISVFGGMPAWLSIFAILCPHALLVFIMLLL